MIPRAWQGDAKEDEGVAERGGIRQDGLAPGQDMVCVMLCLFGNLHPSFVPTLPTGVEFPPAPLRVHLSSPCLPGLLPDHFPFSLRSDPTGMWTPECSWGQAAPAMGSKRNSLAFSE